MVTYRDLQREYQTYEIYPKNLPIDDVDQSLTESEIIEYRKRMEMVNLTIKYCFDNDVALTCYHFDMVSKTYLPQIVR